MSEAFSRLDGSTLWRSARAAAEGLLVVSIALQGALAAALVALLAAYVLDLRDGGDEPVRSIIAAAAGGLLAPFVAGWWVLGGWRGGLRAVGVVLVAFAAGAGTWHSPLLRERARPDTLPLAAAFAAAAAAAMTGVALTMIAARRARRGAPGVGPAPDGAPDGPSSGPSPGAAARSRTPGADAPLAGEGQADPSTTRA